MKLIFEKSVAGRRCVSFPKTQVPAADDLPAQYCRTSPCALPEVSELTLVRHFTKLSRMNFSVDTNFYPLGSCTMKYNPKILEDIAALGGFTDLHPLLPHLKGGEALSQGALEVLYKMESLLCEITGMDRFTMEPAAGAHGELTGVMLIAAYHRAQGNKKKYILVPDSAHGTNPASAAIAGYEIISIPSNQDGLIDIPHLKDKLTNEVAGIMLTCPNTLGLFNSDIDKITKLAHAKGALVYYDGANLNAILGKCRPGDLGFDIIHLNLHKTFGTPHGGGGPGAGPVGVKEEFARFLPTPRIIKKQDGSFGLDHAQEASIGAISSFYGNFLVILKAYAYIRLLGREGLIRTSEYAVLAANYVLARLKGKFAPAVERRCMHECVLSARQQAERGVRALDIAKFLIDKGIHPPTVYFPLIVNEALMIEPTETESKETLDYFIDCMIEADRLSREDPQALTQAPLTTPVRRLDEARAARQVNCALL